MLKENGDKVPAADKDAIESAVKELKDVLDSGDAEKIKGKTEALTNASMKMGEAMYKQQQGSDQPAGDAANAGDGEAPKDEKVMDADFEEVKK
jgi:molecular chaperone DnaK